MSLSEYSENEFKKYYNQKDNIIKPYAFSIFFRQPQINGQEIILEDKRFEMNMTIENYETAITIYNAFNHQKNKKFLINQNSWILQNIVLIPEKEIKEKEDRLNELDELLADPAVSTNSAKLNEISKEQNEISERLDELMDQWEILSDQLD